MTPLEQLLAAREERWHRRLALSRQGTVVTLTVNVPGPQKNHRRWRALWQQFYNELNQQLCRWPIVASEWKLTAAGPEAHWVVRADSNEVKSFLVKLEEHHIMGRLIDLDVMDSQGQVIGRAQLGKAPRPCLCCNGDAKSCVASRRHSLSDVVASASALMDRAGLPDDAAWLVARKARQALELEAALWPKPGLVTPRGTGSHDDMDFPLLCKSAGVLEEVFARCVQLGASGAELHPSKTWPNMRHLGRLGEQDMLAATKGVNTHKGALFQLGLLCAASGRLHSKGKKITSDSLCLAAASFVTNLVTQDLESVRTPRTAGERAFYEQGLSGVRGEACAAFPLARKGLELYKQLRSQRVIRRDASVQTLLFFMAQNDDTTLFHRGGIEGLRWLQSQAQQTLASGGILTAMGRRHLMQLEQQCITHHLSPGGSADLLAVVFFLKLMEPQPSL